MNWNIFKRNNSTSQQTENNELQYVRPFSSGALLYGCYSNGAAMSISAVFAAVDIISNSLAELPIEVKDKTEKNCDNVIKKHALLRLFDTYNMSKFIFVKQLMVDMLLYGNGFAYINRNYSGEPIELIYLPRNSVSIQYTPTKKELYYIVSGYINVPSKVYPKDMLHFLKNSNDGVNGRGIISYASRTVEIANYTEEAAKDYFGSGCGIKGILKFNEQVLDIDKEEIRTNWNQVHGGGTGSGLAICDYNVDFIPVSQNANDSQMIETRLYNVTDVARFFGISPVLLQDLSHSSYSTIEASQLEFLTHTLLPYISLIEAELNRKLGNDSIYIDLDETYLMTTDRQAKANYIKTLISSGVICINEGRAMLGLSPIVGGDKHIIAYTNINDNTINKTENEE